MLIRGTHPYVFRSGKWATLINIVIYNNRECYHVIFPDDREDYWVVADTMAGYEFKDDAIEDDMASFKFN